MYEHEGRTVEVIAFEELASRVETATFFLSQAPEILSSPTKPGLPRLGPEL